MTLDGTATAMALTTAPLSLFFLDDDDDYDSFLL